MPLLQVAFKIHDPMDGDRLVPSEPEQQVTWWVLTAQPLETPYCAWAAEAGSEQACRIGFTASLPLAIGCAAALRPARLALSRGNGHVSNGGRSFPTANPTASNTVRGVPRKASISQRRHSGDLSFHLAPAWSRPPPDVPKGLEKGTSNAVPPEGSETEWTREEGRVTVGEDSTSSPLRL